MIKPQSPTELPESSVGLGLEVWRDFGGELRVRVRVRVRVKVRETRRSKSSDGDEEGFVYSQVANY